MIITDCAIDFIGFKCGTYIDFHHDQSCCENNYAYCKAILDNNVSTKTGKRIDVTKIEFNDPKEETLITPVDDGFLLHSKLHGKFFIPCYSEQNGYYSNDVEFTIYDDDGEKLQSGVTYTNEGIY